MSFVEQTYSWAEPYRPSSTFDRIRQWRDIAISLFARPKRTAEEALINAVERGKTRQARKLLEQGAAYDAENFKALRIVTARQDYGRVGYTLDQFGFTPEVVAKFAYAGLTQAASGQSEETDSKFLWKLSRIVDNDIPGRRDEKLQEIQLQAMRHAAPETIKLLLDARPQGYNKMLNEKRDLAAAGLVDPLRDAEINTIFGNWAVAKTNRPQVFPVRISRRVPIF